MSSRHIVRLKKKYPGWGAPEKDFGLPPAIRTTGQPVSATWTVCSRLDGDRDDMPTVVAA